MTMWFYVQLRMKGQESDLQQAKQLVAQWQTAEGHECPPPENSGGAIVLWHGEHTDAPPEDFAEELSRRFPHAEIELAISGSDPDEGQTIRYRNGQRELLYARYEYFESCDPENAPVHHWDIDLAFESEDDCWKVVTALEAEGVIIDGYPGRDGLNYRVTARKGGNKLMAWITMKCPDVRVSRFSSMPFTLDEDYYLNVLRSRVHSLGPGGPEWMPPPVPQNVQEDLHAVERDIELTPGEMHWVIEELLKKGFTSGCIDFRVFPRLQQLRHCLGRAEFDSRYLSIMRQVFRQREGGDRPPMRQSEEQFESGFALLTPAEAAELGYCRVYQPTKEELEFVLDHYSKCPELPDSVARVEAIKTAIEAPRWTREWPQWDRATEGSSGEQTERDPDDPNDAFLRELESLDAAEEAQYPAPPPKPEVTPASTPMTLGEVLEAARNPPPEAVINVRCLGHDHHYYAVVAADSSITAFTAPYPETIFLNLDLKVDWDVLLLAAVPLASPQALEKCRGLLGERDGIPPSDPGDVLSQENPRPDADSA